MRGPFASALLDVDASAKGEEAFAGETSFRDSAAAPCVAAETDDDDDVLVVVSTGKWEAFLETNGKKFSQLMEAAVVVVVFWGIVEILVDDGDSRQSSPLMQWMLMMVKMVYKMRVGQKEPW